MSRHGSRLDWKSFCILQHAARWQVGFPQFNKGMYIVLQVKISGTDTFSLWHTGSFRWLKSECVSQLGQAQYFGGVSLPARKLCRFERDALGGRCGLLRLTGFTNYRQIWFRDLTWFSPNSHRTVNVFLHGDEVHTTTSLQETIDTTEKERVCIVCLYLYVPTSDPTLFNMSPLVAQLSKRH